MTIDLEELKRLAQAATPGPWRWWTSCSFRRLSSDVTGGDGDVLHAVTHVDGVADVVGTEQNKAFIAAANPAAVLALIERVERAEKDAEKYKAGVLIERAFGHEMMQRWGGEAEKRILIGARVATLESLARKGLEAYHKGSGCPAAQHVDNPAECSHAACREWAAALEAK